MGKNNGYSECERKVYTTSDDIKKQFASYLYSRECNEITGQWTCPKCPFNKECDQNIEKSNSGVELCEAILGPEVTAGIRKRTAANWEAHKKNPNGIYYIENTVDEWHAKISGYFKTLGDAQDGLKECADWYRPKGTGKIYFNEFGLDKPARLVFEAR